MFVLITSSQTFRNTTPWAEILTFTLNVIVKKQSHAQTQLRCPGNGSSRQVTARNYCATPSYTVPGDGGEVRAGGDAVLPAGGDRGPRSPRGAVSRVDALRGTRAPQEVGRATWLGVSHVAALGFSGNF